LRTGNHYAIWDDHDFGPNDANASYTYKGDSLEVFRRYWPNGAGGMPGVPGIFRAVSHYDVDFFLLDGRFNRDADAAQGLAGKSMLGAAQLRWLKNALLASTASFRIIVAGNQMLKPVPPRVEGWSNFPDERREFLDWLADNRVPGVLFLSGDRHHTGIDQAAARERLSAPRLHLLAPDRRRARTLARRGHGRGRAGTSVAKRNFCTLDVSGAWADRTLTLRSFDAEGGELWRRDLSVRDLRHAQ
jgi:alkaline phosphatase D